MIIIKEFIEEFDFYVALIKLIKLKISVIIIKIFFKKQEKKQKVFKSAYYIFLNIHFYICRPKDKYQ